MIPLPPDPTRGEDILTWARGIQACLRRLRLTSGPGIRINEGTNSTTISADPKGKGGSAPAVPNFFELRVETDPEDTATPPAKKVRVYASTLAGGSSTDIGFTEGDDPGYYLTPSEGILIGGITVDQTTGEVTSRWLEIVEEMPANTEDTFHVEIGTVAAGETAGTWIVSNSRYGPIDATICRNWYAGEAPYFGVSFV